MAALRNVRNREKAEHYWPLRGSVYAPTDYTVPNQAQHPPNTTLQLEYVYIYSLLILNERYGYRGYDCRDNLFLNSQNQLVFHCAAVCIVFDTENKKQRFYTEHTDDITWLVEISTYFSQIQVWQCTQNEKFLQVDK